MLHCLFPQPWIKTGDEGWATVAGTVVVAMVSLIAVVVVVVTVVISVVRVVVVVTAGSLHGV